MLARRAVGRLFVPLVVRHDRQCLRCVARRQGQHAHHQPAYLRHADATGLLGQLRGHAGAEVDRHPLRLLDGRHSAEDPPLSGSPAPAVGPESDAPGSPASCGDASPANSDIRTHPTPLPLCSPPSTTRSASASHSPRRTSPTRSPAGHYSDIISPRLSPPAPPPAAAGPATLPVPVSGRALRSHAR